MTIRIPHVSTKPKPHQPTRYTDPSGRCVHGDTACWEAYDTAVEELGFVPAGLSNWDTVRLQDLAAWVQRGLTFFPQSSTAKDLCYPPLIPDKHTFGGWNSIRLGYILEAVQRIEKVVGTDKTSRLLGLNVEPMYIYNLPGRNDDLGIGGTFYGNRIRIFLPEVVQNSEYPIETMIHEFGHSFSYRAGNFAGSSTWILATGRDTNNPTKINPIVERGVISNYALLNSGEDFAETFKWYIEHFSGNTIDRYTHGVPSFKLQAYNQGILIAPSIDRQDAIRDLINNF